jgi:hypothetical protein
VTPLGAAGVDDGAATTGAHTDEKTVSALATNDGGLVSAFHDRVPCGKSARLQPVRAVFVKHYFQPGQSKLVDNFAEFG